MKEFLTQPGIYECALILAGIFGYKIISFFMGIIHMYKYYREVGNSAFTILLSTYLMAVAGLEYKASFLREAGLDETQIANLVRKDKQQLEEWKNVSLQGLYGFAPNIFKEMQESFDKDK